jgi:hypothetical protein
MPLNLNLPGMKKSSSSGNTGLEQTANCQHTATGAESSFTTVNATLGSGAVGIPLVLRASGSVSGIVRIQIGNSNYYDLPVAPNQLPVDYPIPPSAFSNPTNQVPILFMAFAAGTLSAVVVFKVANG